MNKIFFTSDLHFCHDKPFLYTARGFQTIEEMNEAIINNYNTIVGADDIVYILGDCCLMDTTKGIELLKRLNGHKFLAIGNHDSDARVAQFAAEKIFEDIQFGYRIKGSRYKTLLLTHYPTMVTNSTNDRIFNLHGHTHGKEKFQFTTNLNYCVGLDAHNNKPVSLETVLSDLNTYKGEE